MGFDLTELCEKTDFLTEIGKMLCCQYDDCCFQFKLSVDFCKRYVPDGYQVHIYNDLGLGYYEFVFYLVDDGDYENYEAYSPYSHDNYYGYSKAGWQPACGYAKLFLTVHGSNIVYDEPDYVEDDTGYVELVIKYYDNETDEQQAEVKFRQESACNKWGNIVALQGDGTGTGDDIAPLTLPITNIEQYDDCVPNIYHFPFPESIVNAIVIPYNYSLFYNLIPTRSTEKLYFYINSMGVSLMVNRNSVVGTPEHPIIVGLPQPWYYQNGGLSFQAVSYGMNNASESGDASLFKNGSGGHGPVWLSGWEIIQDKINVNFDRPNYYYYDTQLGMFIPPELYDKKQILSGTGINTWEGVSIWAREVDSYNTFIYAYTVIGYSGNNYYVNMFNEGCTMHPSPLPPDGSGADCCLRWIDDFTTGYGLPDDEDDIPEGFAGEDEDEGEDDEDESEEKEEPNPYYWATYVNPRWGGAGYIGKDWVVSDGSLQTSTNGAMIYFGFGETVILEVELADGAQFILEPQYGFLSYYHGSLCITGGSPTKVEVEYGLGYGFGYACSTGEHFYDLDPDCLVAKYDDISNKFTLMISYDNVVSVPTVARGNAIASVDGQAIAIGFTGVSSIGAGNLNGSTLKITKAKGISPGSELTPSYYYDYSNGTYTPITPYCTPMVAGCYCDQCIGKVGGAKYKYHVEGFGEKLSFFNGDYNFDFMTDEGFIIHQDGNPSGWSPYFMGESSNEYPDKIFNHWERDELHEGWGTTHYEGDFYVYGYIGWLHLDCGYTVNNSSGGYNSSGGQARMLFRPKNSDCTHWNDTEMIRNFYYGGDWWVDQSEPPWPVTSAYYDTSGWLACLKARWPDVDNGDGTYTPQVSQDDYRNATCAVTVDMDGCKSNSSFKKITMKHFNSIKKYAINNKRNKMKSPNQGSIIPTKTEAITKIKGKIF